MKVQATKDMHILYVPIFQTYVSFMKYTSWIYIIWQNMLCPPSHKFRNF